MLTVVFYSCINSNYEKKKDNRSITGNQTKEFRGEIDSINNKEVIVLITEYDTIRYFTKELLKYKKTIAEINGEPFPINPKIAYERRGIYNGNLDSRIDFGSEAGEDKFFILYAYFLKEQNGIEEYFEKRKRLTEIYNLINSINSHLKYGGTYFGHQMMRIPGYVEYSIYKSINNDYYEKKYAIVKQKKLFIKSLEQLILDEEKFDYYTLNKDKKKKRRDKMLNEVRKLNELITDYFYLKEAQEFHYSKY